MVVAVAIDRPVFAVAAMVAMVIATVDTVDLSRIGLAVRVVGIVT